MLVIVVEERFAENGERRVATLNNGRRKLNPESRNGSRVLELRVLTAGRICEYKTHGSGTGGVAVIEMGRGTFSDSPMTSAVKSRLPTPCRTRLGAEAQAHVQFTSVHKKQATLVRAIVPATWALRYVTA